MAYDNYIEKPYTNETRYERTNLDLCILLTGIDMVTTVDKIPNELPKAGTAQLHRIIVLLY